MRAAVGVVFPTAMDYRQYARITWGHLTHNKQLVDGPLVASRCHPLPALFAASLSLVGFQHVLLYTVQRQPHLRVHILRSR